MLTYLLRRPMEYASHVFRHCSVEIYFRIAVREVYMSAEEQPAHPVPGSDLQRDCVAVKPRLQDRDYPFRPAKLAKFPLYFFIAGCVPVLHLDHRSMDWEVLRVSGVEIRQRSYEATPVMSKAIPELHLLTPAGEAIHKYGFYVRLEVDVAWSVPVIHGKMPKVPGDNATPYEKGIFALFLMMLFRPHRNIRDVFPATLHSSVCDRNEDDPWNAVYMEFCRWRRDEIDAVAASCKQRLQEDSAFNIEFDSDFWWACLIHEKLRNYETSMRPQHGDLCTVPHDLAGLPQYKASRTVDTEVADVEAPKGDDSSDDGNELWRDFAGPSDFIDSDAGKVRARAPAAKNPLATHCGVLPQGTQLEDFHNPPLKRGVRTSAEERYWRECAERLGESLPSTLSESSSQSEHVSWQLDASDALSAAERQKAFFQAVDKFEYEAMEVTQPRSSSFFLSENKFEGRFDDYFEGDAAEIMQPRQSVKKDSFDADVERATAALKRTINLIPSETVVMQAAYYLIHAGLLNIPDVGTVNVKQARAFLWNAAWLQEYMNAKWRHEGKLQSPQKPSPHPKMQDFCLAIVGPGGTGKTAILKLTEALTLTFAGPDTVRKLAPSNAAARLLGGDTLHALCKLPFGKSRLHSKQGRLSKSLLQRFRQQWRSTISAYLDEISMVSADQFLQCDVRLRQAKMEPECPFGKLGMNFCGDFLQLPPVDKDGTRKSLALPLDDKGFNACAVDDADPEINVGEAKDRNQQALLEGRQGFELWRSISRVVCLNVNVRAPGVLSRLQSEMRAGYISDSMWQLYLSRVIEPNDPRLTDKDSPFANKVMHFVVHRHKIRVMRALENAKEQSRKLNVPLFILQASDQAVRAEDEAKLTSVQRTELLQRVNPDKTKGLPSFLPLYIGMRLFLTSKDCVRFGIMKGCPCILRDIVFSDYEILPQMPISGHPHFIQYMPISLLLQAEDVEWSLPRTELPEHLPANIDRRGLWQLRPSFDHLSIQVGIEYISVRRTTFLATPADTITVYAAQGSTFDAVVADMQKPPRMESSKHWLACYVMLSRARSLEGFLVLRPATRAELSARPPKYLMDELERLERLEGSSLQELVDYINTLPMETPEDILNLFHKDAAANECRLVGEHRACAMQKSTVANAVTLPVTPATPPACFASKKDVPLTPPPMTPPSKRRRLTGKQSLACASNHLLCGNAPVLGCVPYAHSTTARTAAAALHEGQRTRHDDAVCPGCEEIQKVLGVAMDEQPRPFRNALADGWGAGSCFINAALQFLFASKRVRAKLGRILGSIAPHLRGNGTELWRFCERASAQQIRSVDHADFLCNVEEHGRFDEVIAGANAQHVCAQNDVYLALTLASAMKGRSDDGTSLLGQALYPALILRHHYRGDNPQQEDANMFLFGFLTSTQTFQDFSGKYEVPYFQCETCGHKAPAGSHEDEQNFNIVNIHSNYISVRDAILATYYEKLDEFFEACCSNPACGRRWSHKCKPIAKLPKLLWLQVNQWEYSNDLRARRVETDISAFVSNRQADI